MKSSKRFSPTLGHSVRPFWWDDDELWYVDQRGLPAEAVQVRAAGVGAVIDAIEASAVTGSRALAMFAALGVVLARRDAPNSESGIERLRALADARGLCPYALERVRAAPPGTELEEARAIIEENENIDRSIAKHAQTLLPTGGAVLTHGGSGALCTGGFGTAAGAIVTAQQLNRAVHAYVGETRPLLTGSRLTAYELSAAGVVCTIVPDSAVATLMRTIPIAAAIVGAIALAANGDAIGELGTYGMAVAAAHHRIPFYVAVPRASIDRSIPRGEAFATSRALTASHLRTWSAGSGASETAELATHVDLTPGHLIGAIITEYGVTRQPFYESLPALASRPHFAFVHREAMHVTRTP